MVLKMNVSTTSYCNYNVVVIVYSLNAPLGWRTKATGPILYKFPQNIICFRPKKVREHLYGQSLKTTTSFSRKPLLFKPFLFRFEKPGCWPHLRV